MLEAATEDGVWLAALLWKKRISILVWTLLMAMVSFGVWTIVPGRYVAEGTLLVEPGDINIPELRDLRSPLRADAVAASVRSQTYLLTSRATISAVVDSLRLYDVPELTRDAVNGPETKPNWGVVGAAIAGLPQKIAGFLSDRPTFPSGGSSGPDPDKGLDKTVQARAAVDWIERRLSVVQDPRDFAIRLRYADSDPQLAAAVINGVMKQYLLEAAEFRSKLHKSATESLNDRAAELRQSVEEADTRAEKFRTQYQLAETRFGTVTAQQLADMNAELTQAKTALTQAEANYLLASNDPTGAGIPQVLTSPLVIALRERENDLLRHEAYLGSMLGDRHPEMIAVRTELQRLGDNLHHEVQKIVAGIASARNTARDRVTSTASSVKELEAKLAERSRARAELNQIEREADAVRGAYEEFLTRVGQQTNPDTLAPNARVASAAVPPNELSLKALPVVGAGGFTGLLLGCCLVVLGHHRQQGFRSLAQLSKQVGVSALGVLPYDQRLGRGWDHTITDAIEGPSSSPLIESVRGLRVQMLSQTEGPSPRAVLFTSAIAQEGKSVAAAAFAMAAAVDGLRVLVIECDLHRPKLASRLNISVSTGIEDVLAGRHHWREGIEFADGAAGPHWLLARSHVVTPLRYFRPESFGKIVAEASLEYDLVVLDTPPVMHVSDAIALSEFSDAIVLVVSSETPRAMVVEAARRLLQNSDRRAWAVISKVQTPGELEYYRGYRSSRAA